MTNIIKKDHEIREKLREQTEKLKEAKDKIKDIVVEKMNMHTSSSHAEQAPHDKKI